MDSYAMLAQVMMDSIARYQEGLMKTQELMGKNDVRVGSTPHDVIYVGRKIRLLHYKPVTDAKNLHPIPVIVTYALINKHYILDLQEDRSFVGNLIKQGFDVYMVDWGTPEPIDKHLTFDDYVGRYLDRLVDMVRDRSGAEKVTLLGYCQGGTMSTMYTTLKQEKVANLVTIAPVIDTEKDTSVVANLCKSIDADRIIDTYGNLPAEFLHRFYMMLKPFTQGIYKYINLLDNLDDEYFVSNFLRVEKWLFDTPAIAGGLFKQWINDIYKGNLFVKGKFYLCGKRIDLKSIEVPLLNIVASDDHLVAPECSIPLNYHVSSEDKMLRVYNCGHIGLIASKLSQSKVLPEVGKWLRSKSSKRLEQIQGRL
ncbi:MAG: class III poly(R)-hydroxyalkanoic acid synthase subunit PhaC [Candidatus Nitrosocaldus sp.]